MGYIDERMKDLEEEKKPLEEQYGVEIRIRLSYWGGFTGGGGETALLAFLFGAIAGGFFAEMGKDLWVKLKEFTKRITDRQGKRRDDSKATIVVIFKYQAYQITATLELDKERAESLRALYDTDPVEIFWEDLAAQANQITKMIDEKNEFLEGASAVGLRLGQDKREWVVTKAVEGLDIDDYVKPTPKRKNKRVRPRKGANKRIVHDP